MPFGNRFGREQELAFHLGLPHGRTAGYFNKVDPPAVLHLKRLLTPLASLSLAANHAVGAFLGRLVFLFSPRYRKRLVENLGGSGLAATAADAHRMARENAAEIGKGATELVWALFRPPDEVASKVTRRVGWEAVERLREGNR